MSWGNLRCVMLFHLLWLVMRRFHQSRQDLEQLLHPLFQTLCVL